MLSAAMSCARNILYAKNAGNESSPMNSSPLQIKSFVFGPFQTNTYVVSDRDDRILLVDPACYFSYEKQELLNYINSLLSAGAGDGKSVSGTQQLTIVATHGHLDHLWGASWACAQWNTPVLLSPADIEMAQAMQQQYELFGIRATPEPFPIEPLQSASLSSFGIRVIGTPGHTPGSVCLYWEKEKVLLSGDTLFHYGYGRTDLPGGDFHQLLDSLERLFSLPPDVAVYPGHGGSTTIAAERRAY